MKNRRKHIIKFYRHRLDILVDIFFVMLILISISALFFIIRELLQLIPNIETILGNLISASVSLLVFIAGLFSKFRKGIVHIVEKTKQSIYSMLSKHNVYLLSKSIVKFNEHAYLKTQGQGNAINIAINVLRAQEQGIISIESTPGRGKTTTALLLMDVIGSDAALLDLFIHLNNNVLYFDMGNDIDDLINFLSRHRKNTNLLIVIDNLHKLSPKMLNNVLDYLYNTISYLKEIQVCFLVILMYQSHSYTKTITKYIQDFSVLDDINSYIVLDETNTSYIKNDSNKKQIIKKYPLLDFIDDELLKLHIHKILNKDYNAAMCSFIYKVVICEESFECNRLKYKELLQMFSEIILSGIYSGFVNRKSLHTMWKSYSHNDFKYLYMINMFKRSGFLIPFPLVKNTYLFNEHLAWAYKKRLIQIPEFVKLLQQNAKEMYFLQEKSPARWLYLVSTDIDFYKTIDTETENSLFDNCLSHFNTNYVIDILEREMELFPEKEQYLSKKIGLLYIRNGEWKKARKILSPLLNNLSDQNEAYELFLKIIEADHGINDTSNLQTLELIKENSTDNYIVFKADYWKTHIQMEQGNFDLDMWKSLYDRFLSLEKVGYTDEVIHYRIISDYARVYFLSGIHDYEKINFIFQKLNIEKLNSPKIDAENTLITRAHYIHYETIYQIGIWEYPNNTAKENDYVMKLLKSEEPLYECMEEAKNAYTMAINKYNELGDKKIHTAAARLNDLKLCYSDCKYIDIISEFNKFYSYSKENKISVFEGYAETLLGKAFILYADSKMLKGQSDVSDLFKRAKLYLDSAYKHYKDYGNLYGCLRAELLLLLLTVIRVTPSKSSINDIYNKISNLIQKYDMKHRYLREYNVLNYFKDNIRQVAIARRILKFYPIILQ